MARGFESKQVEHQQAEAERRRERRARGPAPDPAAAGRRRSLELAQADVRRRLEAARDDRLKDQLRLALAALEKELAALPDARNGAAPGRDGLAHADGPAEGGSPGTPGE